MPFSHEIPLSIVDFPGKFFSPRFGRPFIGPSGLIPQFPVGAGGFFFGPGFGFLNPLVCFGSRGFPPVGEASSIFFPGVPRNKGVPINSTTRFHIVLRAFPLCVGPSPNFFFPPLCCFVVARTSVIKIGGRVSPLRVFFVDHPPVGYDWRACCLKYLRPACSRGAELFF